MKIISLLALFVLLSSISVKARLLLASKDGGVILDPSRFRAGMKSGVDAINGKCNSCHDLTRIIKALETGRTANGSTFGKAEAREFVIKKMRRPGVTLSQQEARDVIQVMESILEEASESRPVRGMQKKTVP